MKMMVCRRLPPGPWVSIWTKGDSKPEISVSPLFVLIFYMPLCAPVLCMFGCSCACCTASLSRFTMH